jgi:hypothetical protein
MELMKTGWEDVDWINLAQERDQVTGCFEHVIGFHKGRGIY